jgi:hypothetical protein
VDIDTTDIFENLSIKITIPVGSTKWSVSPEHNSIDTIIMEIPEIHTINIYSISKIFTNITYNINNLNNNECFIVNNGFVHKDPCITIVRYNNEIELSTTYYSNKIPITYEIIGQPKYDMDNIRSRMNIICEELMRSVFHPKNIEKFVGWGF